MALKAPWIRDIQGKGRFTLKLSDVGSFDGIAIGISDDFPGRRWREIPSQVTVEVGISVPQGVRTPRFEARRPVEWLEISADSHLKTLHLRPFRVIVVYRESLGSRGF